MILFKLEKLKKSSNGNWNYSLKRARSPLLEDANDDLKSNDSRKSFESM